MVEYLISTYNSVAAFVMSAIGLIPTRNLLSYEGISHIIVLAIPIVLLLFIVHLRSKRYKRNFDQSKYMQQRLESIMKAY
jgi:cbb3-type cytochrome oxidase subunit 3